MTRHAEVGLCLRELVLEQGHARVEAARLVRRYRRDIGEISGRYRCVSRSTPASRRLALVGRYRRDIGEISGRHRCLSRATPVWRRLAWLGDIGEI